jgi:hypothetical protein
MGLGIGEVAVRWLQTRSPVLERRANELGLFLYQKGEA